MSVSGRPSVTHIFLWFSLVVKTVTITNAGHQLPQMSFTTQKTNKQLPSRTSHCLNVISNELVVSRAIKDKLDAFQEKSRLAVDLSDSQNELPFNDLNEWRSKRKAEIAFQMELERKHRHGEGDYLVVEEKDLFDLVLQHEKVVCHFFHDDFKRCEVLNAHMKRLAMKYFDTQFVRVDATKAPFVTEKFHIRVLPTLAIFLNGIRVKQMVGFSELGGSDSFKTSRLERFLLKHQAIQRNAFGELSSSSHSDEC